MTTAGSRGNPQEKAAVAHQAAVKVVKVAKNASRGMPVANMTEKGFVLR
jgi:hypothetical protein